MTCRPLNILLIDDDEINNFLTTELISLSCPHTVIQSVLYVKNALDLLEKKNEAKEPFSDVILLDINMPVMTGWDFIEEFEKMDRHFTQNIKLYIYTSSVYFEDINKAKTYPSVRNIFSKPLTQEMIEEFCGSK